MRGNSCSFRLLAAVPKVQVLQHITDEYYQIETANGFKILVARLLGIDAAQVLALQDLREAANLLYRDTISQKHADTSRLSLELDTRSLAVGKLHRPGSLQAISERAIILGGSRGSVAQAEAKDKGDDTKDTKKKVLSIELLVKHLMQVSLSDCDIGSGNKQRHVDFAEYRDMTWQPCR